MNLGQTTTGKFDWAGRTPPMTRTLPYNHYNRHRGTSRTIYHADGTKTELSMSDMPVSRGDQKFLEDAKQLAEQGKLLV